MLDPQLIGTLAIVGATVALWSQLRALAARFSSLVVSTATIEDSPLAVAVRSYCMRRLRISKLRWRVYAGTDVFVRPEGGIRLVAFERAAGVQLFWNGWRPLLLKYDAAQDRGSVRLWWLRGTLRADDFVQRVIDGTREDRITRAARRYRVVQVIGRPSEQRAKGDDAKADRGTVGGNLFFESRILHWGVDDLGPEVGGPGSAIAALALPVEAELAVAEARFWRKSETWYRDRGIPWRRGWLLHGSPGTGKTSLARAVAEELDLPVYAFDLSSLANDELRTAWSSMLRDVPCMALIEDIDGVFDGRRNVSRRPDSLSFDTLLNCIDGVERSSGVFLVITTNRVQAVDPAIGAQDSAAHGGSTRPGRIDRVIELATPDVEGLLRICRRVLPDAPSVWAGVIRSGHAAGDTGARFQERCARQALMLHWGAKDGSAVSEPVNSHEAAAPSAGRNAHARVDAEAGVVGRNGTASRRRHD